MGPENRNNFLDVSDSEDDQNDNYDSEEDLRKGGRSVKRRKIETELDIDDFSDAEDRKPSAIHKDRSENDDKEDPEEVVEEAEIEGDPQNVPVTSKKAPKLRTAGELPDITRPLTKKNLVATEAAIKKSGVVYLSRIPPFMKPAKLRSLLEPYGKINRIFLAPEDPTAHTRRVKAGGNKKKTYTEGWVEFVKKREAKSACDLLNAQIIGGKKSSYYHDDLWNLLYLKGFKWHNLTEQIAAENAERTSRMRAEISKTTKENKEFVKNVERAKMLDGIQSKAKKRSAAEQVDEAEDRSGGRSFRQTQLATKKNKDGEEQPERVTRVLSKIF